MPASYPSSAKTFTTKSNTTTADASHINDLQLEVTAIEQDLIAGLPIARGGTGTTTAAWSVNTLTFPAVQVASADANTLDDYEEGTWTPSVGGNATYTFQVGTYTKIGRQVTVIGIVTINAIGTGSTTAITGLPFTVAGTGTAPVSIGFFDAIASSVIMLGGYASGTTITLAARTAAGTTAGSSAVFQNGARVDFSCTYFV
jgi:hypothetical protein